MKVLHLYYQFGESDYLYVYFEKSHKVLTFFRNISGREYELQETHKIEDFRSRWMKFIRKEHFKRGYFKVSEKTNFDVMKFKYSQYGTPYIFYREYANAICIDPPLRVVDIDGNHIS